MDSINCHMVPNGGQEENKQAENQDIHPSLPVLLPKKRKLILHLDLNNTILVSDAATGQGPRAALNSYLSTVAWGCISDIGEWQWASDQPSVKPPCEDAVNYYTHFGRDANFSDSKLGKRFKNVFNDHMKQLEWQWEADEMFTQKGEDGRSYNWILPSFFHMLESLYLQGRQFCVILRTFGVDLPHVLQSVHAALQGKHPQFPQLQQVPLAMDLVPGRIRCSKRNVVLTRGSDRISTKTKEGNIYHYFSSMDGIGGFQDHFDWWARNSYTGSGGKPFWIDPTDCDTQHIIIDDNIRLTEHDTIVNCRVLMDKEKGKESRKALTSELCDICLVPTDLLRAISEKDYFLDCVRVCEENYEQYLRRFQVE
ncbi:uncharacterized protein LOC130275988 [Hyla sarda]|uniref:uncharacterized protein LOC130275988 n=1 Tax=Hyla sarda TaxID=327740 RepID=UPI0024C3BA6D|nr:uncharacterized protein LOC130275988 [Hyla sarda]XP_056380730.1 uncharacterized protein LOC130275988 [Hyla sarda]XP_056380731.1 uncharacterized protein LOC130275988 [Hyla sarda]XP_056380732.1 uncharacterized protein LOC130275988 [Hyla sarda]XP_056380733.1 uncharacterized protein LOC130275988 [Hyla sarda]